MKSSIKHNEITTVIENNLWVIEKCVSSVICNFFVSHAESNNKKNIENWVFKPCSFNKKLNQNYRNSTEIHIQDYSFQKLFWNSIKSFVPDRCQGRKLIGPHYKTFYLLKYNPGEKFDIHRDGHSTNSNNEKSFITAVLYLNNCEEGGETRFFEEPMHGLCFENNARGEFKCKPTTGNLVLMRHYILHQSLPVIKGVKYALRFNILYEKYGDWFEGPSNPINKLGQVYAGHIRPKGFPEKIYYFLPCHIDNSRPGRLPGPGEDRCENCYEIIDLNYDYYRCPGCDAHVCWTNRDVTHTNIMS